MGWNKSLTNTKYDKHTNNNKEISTKHQLCVCEIVVIIIVNHPVS